MLDLGQFLKNKLRILVSLGFKTKLKHENRNFFAIINLLKLHVCYFLIFQLYASPYNHTIQIIIV